MFNSVISPESHGLPIKKPESVDGIVLCDVKFVLKYTEHRRIVGADSGPYC
jgi:hypothetical protein